MIGEHVTHQISGQTLPDAPGIQLETSRCSDFSPSHLQVGHRVHVSSMPGAGAARSRIEVGVVTRSDQIIQNRRINQSSGVPPGSHHGSAEGGRDRRYLHGNFLGGWLRARPNRRRQCQRTVESRQLGVLPKPAPGVVEGNHHLPCRLGAGHGVSRIGRHHRDRAAGPHRTPRVTCGRESLPRRERPPGLPGRCGHIHGDRCGHVSFQTTQPPAPGRPQGRGLLPGPVLNNCRYSTTNPRTMRCCSRQRSSWNCHRCSIRTNPMRSNRWWSPMSRKRQTRSRRNLRWQLQLGRFAPPLQQPPGPLGLDNWPPPRRVGVGTRPGSRPQSVPERPAARPRLLPRRRHAAPPQCQTWRPPGRSLHGCPRPPGWPRLPPCPW